MYDRIEKIGGSIIQHGKSNNRIYLMKLDKNDYPNIAETLNLLATQHNYTKIFTKIPEWAIDGFQSVGYVKEGFIPNFFNENIDLFFFSKFIDLSRSFIRVEERNQIDSFIKIAISKQGKLITTEKNPNFKIKILAVHDIQKLTELYWKVFRSYPFPIFEKSYLKKTMNENVIYFGVFYQNDLIAASSAEMDTQSKNVEMTDFATDPKFAGNNLSLILLKEMEAEMRKRKMKTFYTIARSYSAAMNITFAKMDYKYSGTLINNTNISAKIESMNVWYKSIN